MEELLKFINNGEIIGVSIEVGELVKAGFDLDLYTDNVCIDNEKLKIRDLNGNAVEIDLAKCDIENENNSMFLITNKENNMIIEMSFI